MKFGGDEMSFGGVQPTSDYIEYIEICRWWFVLCNWVIYFWCCNQSFFIKNSILRNLRQERHCLLKYKEQPCTTQFDSHIELRFYQNLRIAATEWKEQLHMTNTYKVRMK